MEKAVVSYQHQCQQPWSRRERDLNDPKLSMKPGDSQMMLPGLMGEDPQFKIRQQKQKDQLRQWLIQQQSDQTAQRHQQKLEGGCQTAHMWPLTSSLNQNTGTHTHTHIAPLGGVEPDSISFLLFFSDQLHDQCRVEMDSKALELQSVEMQTRVAAAAATKEHNLAMVSPSADSGDRWEGR